MSVAQTKEQFDHHRGRKPLLVSGGRRAFVFLSASFAGFVAVNAFWHYLGTGRWFTLAPATVWHEVLSPVGELFIFPLDIFAYPWMILVDSLLLGVMMAIPVILAVLYRLPVACAFIAVIVLVAHAPLLALAAATGAVLAARTRLRSDMPFLAILLGLLPLAVYLYGLGFGAQDWAAGVPLRRLALNAPFVIAMVAAVLMAAAVLGLARLTRFRPGVVLPVLVILSAVPLAVFYAFIGTGELDYNLIANPARLAAGDAVFQSVDVEGASPVSLAAMRQRLVGDLPARKAALIAECDNFLRRHPRSTRGPAVMWVRAQCASAQLERPSAQAQVRFTAEFAAEDSRALWEAMLAEPYRNSPQAALAQWRLGQLDIRSNRLEPGVALLQSAVQRMKQLREQLGGPDPTDALARMFTQPSPMPDRRYYTEALFNAEYLLWLIAGNDVKPQSAASEALAQFLDLNPHSENYARELDALAEKYAQTPLGDNLRLAAACASNRIHVIDQIASGPPSDAAIEANFELGRLAMRGDPVAAAKYFQAVRDARPSPFTAVAEERLAWLRPRGVPGSRD